VPQLLYQLTLCKTRLIKCNTPAIEAMWEIRVARLLVLLCVINIGFCQARNVRSRRESDDLVQESESLETSTGVTDKKDTLEDEDEDGFDLIKAIRDALAGAVETLQGVFKAKQEAVTPLVEAATRTAEIVQESNVVERLRETASLVIDTKINALQSLLKVVTDTFSKKGSAVAERVGGPVDFAGDVFRVGVCHLFCPLQANATSCRSDNCGPRNKTANGDDDDGTVYYNDYADFETIINRDDKEAGNELEDLD